MKPLRIALLLVVIAVATWLLGSCGTALPGFAPPVPAPGSPGKMQIEDLLAKVQVVAVRPNPPGYQRGCKEGEGCVFGPAWSDDYDGPDGHDGCDTRNNLLARSLTDVTFKQGTHNCVVIAGNLSDPYSGKRLAFTKADAGAIQIDHLYPLAAAWDMGAYAWPIEKRMQFANDVVYNLIAVNGPDNLAKSDKTPSDWLPPDAAVHCYYIGRYLTDAIQYGLPITAADRDASASVADTC